LPNISLASGDLGRCLLGRNERARDLIGANSGQPAPRHKNARRPPKVSGRPLQMG
jgi:hypothetical protein